MKTKKGGDRTEYRNDGNRRKSAKRPDMQVYVPRAKLKGRENQSEEKEMSPSFQQSDDWDMETAEKTMCDEDVVVSGDEQALSPRLVQVKPRGGVMKVTVLNESLSQGESSKNSPGSHRSNEGHKEKQSDKRSFVQKERPGKGRYQQDTHSNSRSRGDERKSDKPVRSYNRMRRSNSSDSRRSENDVLENNPKESDKSQFSSDTFPRTKPSSAKERKSQIREIYSAGKSSKENSSKGREGEKFYWGMRRQRTGSISSEASFVSNMESSGSFYSGSSDFYTEDDEPEHILDWGEEVEKAHLEELARLVHDGAQKLTSSLGVYPDMDPENVSKETSREEDKQVTDINKQMSMSADRIYQLNPKERRHRRRHRHRKPPSQQSSRDSSVHSTAQSDHSAGGGRRRRRRRHSSQHSQHSQHSQQGDNEVDDVSNNMSGLQVTIGRRTRHVELNKMKGVHSGVERGDYRSPQYEPADWDGEQSMEFNRSDKYHQKWQKEPPPRFRHDSDGRNSDTGSRRIRRESGKNSSRRREGERTINDNDNTLVDSMNWDNRDRRHSDDQRSIHPAHDSSYKGHRKDNKFRNERRKGNRQPEQVNDNFAVPHKMRGGGLLRLPTPDEPPRPHSTPSPSEYHSQHQQIDTRLNSGGNSGSSHLRSSGHGEKHLFDPDNPTKPIVVPQNQPVAPKFEDIDEGHSQIIDSGGNIPSSPEVVHNHHGYPPSFYPSEYPPVYHYRAPLQFRPPGSYPMSGFSPQQAIPPHMFYRFPRMPMLDMNHYNG